MKILKFAIEDKNGKIYEVSFDDYNIIWSEENNTGKTLLSRLLIMALGGNMHLPRGTKHKDFLSEINNIGIQFEHENITYSIKRKIVNNSCDNYLIIEGVPYDTESNTSGTHVYEFYKQIIGWYPINKDKPLSINYLLNFLYKDQDFGVTEFSPLLFPSMYNIKTIDKYMLFKLCKNEKIENLEFEEIEKTESKVEVISILKNIMHDSYESINSNNSISEYDKNKLKNEMKTINALQNEVNVLDREIYKRDDRRNKILASNIEILRVLQIFNNEEAEIYSAKLKDKIYDVNKTLIDVSVLKNKRSELINKIKICKENIKTILNGRETQLVEQPPLIVQKIQKIAHEFTNQIEEQKSKNNLQQIVKNFIFSFLKDNREFSLSKVKEWRGGNASNSGSDLFLREIAKYLHIIENFPGNFPIIIDGVFMNEVDDEAKNKIINFLKNSKKQIIITTIKNIENIKILDEFKKITLTGKLLDSLQVKNSGK